MFGGKENNGTLLSKIRNKSNNSNVESTESDSNAAQHETVTSSKDINYHSPPTQITKITQAGNHRASITKENVLPASRTSGNKSKDSELTSNNTNGNTANVANRITIKVLSPKIGT